jgi:DNA-binding MarR family transcriptional regulator
MEPTSVDDCIIFLLAKAYQRAHQHFKRRLLIHGLTPIQHLILEALFVLDNPSAGDLGRLLSLDAATLSGVLDRLAEAGWVVRNPDPDDKRIIRIGLTERAVEKRDDLVQERQAANEEILRDFSREERVLLKRLLKDIRG